MTHDTQRTVALLQECGWHSKLTTLRSLSDAVELELNVEVMVEKVALAKNAGVLPRMEKEQNQRIHPQQVIPR